MFGFNDTNQTVVANRLSAVFGLFCLQSANDPHRNVTADRECLINQDEHVQCVAVFRDSRGNETEIGGKRRAARQKFPKLQSARRVVQFELTTTPARRVDHDIDWARSTSSPFRLLRSPHRISSERPTRYMDCAHFI